MLNCVLLRDTRSASCCLEGGTPTSPGQPSEPVVSRPRVLVPGFAVCGRWHRLGSLLGNTWFFFFLVVEVSMEWNILWSYTWEQRASKGGRTKQWITSKHSTAGVWGFYFPTLTLQKTKSNQQWKGRSQRGSLRPDPGAPLQSRVWKRQACWTGTAHRQTGRASLTFTTIVCITLLQGNLKMQTFSYSGQNSDMCWVWILYLSERHVSSTAKVHYHHLLNLMCNSLRISEMRFYSKINKF